MNRWIAGSAVLFSSLGFAGWQLARVLDLPKSTPIKLDFTGLMPPARPEQLPGWTPRGSGSIRLLFAGDIMQHGNQQGDDFASTYAAIKPFVEKADIAAGNLEFPVYPKAPLGPKFGTVIFNGSPQQVKALAAAGFDLMSTANNHLFDQGIEGAESTLRIVEEAGMKGVGSAPKGSAVEVKTLPAQGAKIAFAAYTYPPNIYQQEAKSYTLWSRDWPVNELNFNDWTGAYREKGRQYFARDIAAARASGADFTVALVHWGKEWTLQPTEDQRRAAHDLIDAGFDLVVGGHAHVISPPEIYRGKLIAYSLGNLVSDFESMETRLGALLEVRVGAPDGGGRLEVTDFAYRPVLTDRSASNHPVRLVTPGADGWNLAQRVLGTVTAER